MRMVATTQGDLPEPAIFNREISCDGAPPVVVASRDAAALLPALFHRMSRPQSRLLVWADGAPRSWQLARRLALHMADAVLVGDEMAEAEVTHAGKPAGAVFNVPGPYDINAFVHHSAARGADAAYRLVVCGGLTPDGDAINILNSVAAWAERHASRRLELCWVGDGDLRGVLAAQLLPDNLVQHFAGEPDLTGIAAAFLRSGMLIAGTPSRADIAGRGELLARAMASGLVALFESTCPAASRLLRHGVTGFGYQASRGDGLLDALDEAMDTPAAALDQMRGAARMRVLPMNCQGFEERLARAVESVMRDASPPRRSGRRFFSPAALQAR